MARRAPRCRRGWACSSSSTRPRCSACSGRPSRRSSTQRRTTRSGAGQHSVVFAPATRRRGPPTPAANAPLSHRPRLAASAARPHPRLLPLWRRHQATNLTSLCSPGVSACAPPPNDPRFVPYDPHSPKSELRRTLGEVCDAQMSDWLIREMAENRDHKLVSQLCFRAQPSLTLLPALLASAARTGRSIDAPWPPLRFTPRTAPLPHPVRHKRPPSAVNQPTANRQPTRRAGAAQELLDEPPPQQRQQGRPGAAPRGAARPAGHPGAAAALRQLARPAGAPGRRAARRTAAQVKCSSPTGAATLARPPGASGRSAARRNDAQVKPLNPAGGALDAPPWSEPCRSRQGRRAAPPSHARVKRPRTHLPRPPHAAPCCAAPSVPGAGGSAGPPLPKQAVPCVGGVWAPSPHTHTAPFWSFSTRPSAPTLTQLASRGLSRASNAAPPSWVRGCARVCVSS